MRVAASAAIRGLLAWSVAVAAVGCGSEGAPVSSSGQCLGAIPVEVVEDCTELRPGEALPQPLRQCFVVKQAGTYVHDYINILDGGSLYFVEPIDGGTIDFQAKSILIEKGGLLQAGAPHCVFGSANGGRLSIGLYGDDPSDQGNVADAPPGIQCLTNPDSANPCFPADRDPDQATLYCVGDDPVDPCNSASKPQEDPENFLLQGYGTLNFDPTPWGYKAIGVSYGGRLRLYGSKGAKPLLGRKGARWAQSFDHDDHCVVPTPEQSTLDAAEMQHWADLSGESWTRLADLEENDAGNSVLTLDRAVESWSVGDEIVVGTTDWYPGHSERRTVTGVNTVAGPDGDRTQLIVAALAYPHQDQMFDTQVLEDQHGAEFSSSVNRSAADLRAVVGLLTRSIQIRSLGAEPQPGDVEAGLPPVKDCLYQEGETVDSSCYFGGHIVVRQGFGQVQLQGVELKQLGQGGRMGHYPIHFHLVKSTAYAQGGAFVKDSSVWDSMNRFITLHGAHDVALSRNVGYLSVGHGYFIEDGSEINNLLCHNVGISARAALKEYYEAQADPARWRGEPPAPGPEARYIPPILDRSSAGRLGSDTFMPVMYWMMNAYNEFVGNEAVGVYGFGSCYWLLGSGVSGASSGAIKFSGLANYNRAGARHAPLLRFRGNGCTTSTYALPAQAEMAPNDPNMRVGFTAVESPYLVGANGQPRQDLEGNFARPNIVGNFQPIDPAAVAANIGESCSAAEVSEDVLERNTKTCTVTIVDRFTTSFNWAEVNFGSIWFRPNFYLFLNGAVTDQLFGGLTFVTAGSWLQVAPGHFSLAKNSLFVGTTQHGGSRYARRSGPIFSVSAGDNLQQYSSCAPEDITCNLPFEGTGFWRGAFNPKRLINIYDGPNYGDGNTFLNIGSWTCDPQPCQGNGDCVLDELPCGIYSSTTQPLIEGPDGRPLMAVLDAALGWKQPNGFYYPPAFAYQGSSFLKTLPKGLPDADPTGPLNRCLSFGPEDDFAELIEREGDCRHNVLDRTHDYIAGSMINLLGAPTEFLTEPTLEKPAKLPVTPIDFSTILLDLDGSLTGATGDIVGHPSAQPTSSLSRNAFFDAPVQSPECLSFGVQTSPYPFVTSLIAPVAASPTSGDNFIDPWKIPEGKACSSELRGTTGAAGSPLVAVYRQSALSTDPSSECGDVCDGPRRGCPRATFMVGPNVGQAPYLTMATPVGTDSEDSASYYIDTSTGRQKSCGCLRAPTSAMFPADFEPGKSYVVYNLFARNDAGVSYQLHVGGNEINGLDAVEGRYVRVTPHLHTQEGVNQSRVTEPCDPRDQDVWCAGMPVPTVSNGVLSFRLEQSTIANDFLIASRPDYERCMPRDLCFYDDQNGRCEPCYKDPSKCLRQGDFLSEDIASLNRIDVSGGAPLDNICQQWSSVASGTVGDANDPSVGMLSLTDCPAGGCLGFAFKLPDSFLGDRSYADVGESLASCFDESAWSQNALVPRSEQGGQADSLCGPPRDPVSEDYCAPP